MARLFGTAGNDLVGGSGLNDLLFASAGDDTLNGGDLTDTAVYDVGGFVEGVAINNTDAVIDGLAPFTTDKRGMGGDTLISIESFHGSNGDDLIYTGTGADYVLDRGGRDVVVASQRETASPIYIGAGSGQDRYVGSIHVGDTVDYEGVSGNEIGGVGMLGVIVDLANGTARDPWGDGDILIGIEHVWGTLQNDLITGDDGYNILRGNEGSDLLRGGAGDDDIVGGAGDDTLDGGAGSRDEADYSQEIAGIVVDLVTGIVTDGWGGTDLLISIESVRGTEFADRMTGSAADEWLRGDRGDDLLVGGAGNDLLAGGLGNDTLKGGDGDGDRALFEGAWQAVIVDLSAGTASDGQGGTDTLSGIEQIRGTPYNDVLFGAFGATAQFDGAAGHDRLVGGGGAGIKSDLKGGLGRDTLIGGAEGFNFFEPGPEGDLVQGGAGGFNEISYALDWGGLGSGIRVWFTGTGEGRIEDPGGAIDLFSEIEVFRGTGQSDVFLGGAGDQTFRALAGDDTIRGGAGDADKADYSLETDAGIVLNLAEGVAQDSFGGTDLLAGIEHVVGTAGGDWLRGSAAPETLEGGGGADTLAGGGGDDFLRGGSGEDVAVMDGRMNDYAISIWGDRGIIDVADKRADGTGYDGLEGIERLVFSGDGVEDSLDLTAFSGAAALNEAQMMRLIEMYIAYFDRAPDAGGLLYWATRLADGMEMREIAASFFEQDETRALLPEEDGAAALVDAAYANLLEREPDAGGRAYWIAELESGAVSRGAFMLAFINGARGENGAESDVSVIEAKAQIGWRYAVDYGLTDKARAAEAMAGYETRAPSLSLDAVEGLMVEFRDAAVSGMSDELVIRIGAFGADPLFV